MTTARTTLSRVAGMFVLALIFGACSSPSSEPAALTESEKVLVAFEAEWLCDVTRYAYPSLEAMNDSQRSLMDSFEVTPAAYADFKDRLATSAELREHVSIAHSSTCA